MVLHEYLMIFIDEAVVVSSELQKRSNVPETEILGRLERQYEFKIL